MIKLITKLNVGIAYVMLCAVLIAGFGCKKDEEKGPKPVADFTSDITTVCKYEYVGFTDLSKNSPNEFEWYFVGGEPDGRRFSGTSSDIVIGDIFIRYDSIGTFPVSLTVRNKNGESSITKNNYITVISNPRPVVHCSYIGEGLPDEITITYLNVNETVDDIVEDYTWSNYFIALIPERYLGKTVNMKCKYYTPNLSEFETQSVEVTITPDTYVEFTF